MPIFPLVLVSIERINARDVFHYISKHLEVGQTYSQVRRIYKSLFGIWKCGKARSVVFVVLRTNTVCGTGRYCNLVRIIISVGMTKHLKMYGELLRKLYF